MHNPSLPGVYFKLIFHCIIGWTDHCSIFMLPLKLKDASQAFLFTASENITPNLLGVRRAEFMALGKEFPGQNRICAGKM